MDGENLELNGKEMQNKNKNKHKVTKVPTAKLIEIAVANCKKLSQFRDCIDVYCQYFQIENYTKSAIFWLYRFSYDHATRDRKRRKIFRDFRYEFIKKINVKSGEKLNHYDEMSRTLQISNTSITKG